VSKLWEILEGDALSVLRTLPAGAFHCCVTSPPYWSLRDYGTGRWEGGDAGCDHREPTHSTRGGPSSTLTSVGARECLNDNTTKTHARQYRDLCGKCGARRIDLQLGLERSPDCFAWARGVPRCGACYVCRMTDVFSEVKRVLRDDGTLWVNCAGNYNGSGATGGAGKQHTNQGAVERPDNRRGCVGWKQKDYVNVPALLAESLRADGWYLRAEIALTKVAPMPESCRDRPTRATEKLYLFAKKSRYYYDQQAEQGARTDDREGNMNQVRPGIDVRGGNQAAGWIPCPSPTTRNLWDYWGDAPGECDDNLPPAVWQWRPEPSKVRHYATFPLWLPLRVIRLATSARGVCPDCGAPWARVVERKIAPPEVFTNRSAPAGGHVYSGSVVGGVWRGQGQKLQEWRDANPSQTLGWQQTCRCLPADPVPARVLDPFAGTATTGVAARLLGQHFTGVELSPEYAAIARERLAGCMPLDDAAWRSEAAAPAPQPSLFADEETPS
jgi:DNA modification methylase